MRSSILQNIIDFQREAAKISTVAYGCDGTLNWVLNALGKWPHSIIGTAKTEALKAVVTKIEQQKLPPIWIMENETAAVQIDQLEKIGFREINRWEGMWMDRIHFNQQHETSDQYSMNTVQNPELLGQWWNIVKPVMMPNRDFSPELLKAWVEQNEYQLLVGLVNGQAVSAGLSYLNKGVAGLYFIATMPAFRGKGYASRLVGRLIENCFEKGADEIILHASMAGRSMYKKIGFIEDGLISTYWKVGLF